MLGMKINFKIHLISDLVMDMKDTNIIFLLFNISIFQIMIPAIYKMAKIIPFEKLDKTSRILARVTDALETQLF